MTHEGFMKLCPSVFRCSLHDVRDGLGKVEGEGEISGSF